MSYILNITIFTVAHYVMTVKDNLINLQKHISNIKTVRSCKLFEVLSHKEDGTTSFALTVEVAEENYENICDDIVELAQYRLFHEGHLTPHQVQLLPTLMKQL